MSKNIEIMRLGNDVEVEMERLIKIGVPPYDAAIQARQRVSARRRESA